MSFSNNKNSLSNRLALSSTITAALLSGYGSRQAFAGSCNAISGPAGTYLCTGVLNTTTDTTQNINSGANPLNVTTTAGFGIDTSGTGGDALRLITTGNTLSFIDNNTAITGLNRGISATNDGTGSTSITSTGTVTGINSYGIQAFNATNSTDLTINAADVMGSNGIRIRNYGLGATGITSTGTITGINSNGIFAFNTVTTTDLTINAVDVTGSTDGILAGNYGTGATSITSTGTVAGASRYGIFVRNAATITDLTINAADVSGGTFGIYARDYGTGATNITSTGTVTSTSRHGIYASNKGTSLTITAADVTAGDQGIYARNYGTDDTSITSSGIVSGRTGINATNAATAGDININVTDINSTYAIIATNNGTGNLTITATGTINTGDNSVYYGAGVRANANGGNLTINVMDLSAATYAITAGNSGAGDTTITTTGMVVGGVSADYGGISVGQSGTGNIILDVNNVSGAYYGINTRQNGTGDIRITANGVVNVTGNYSGINPGISTSSAAGINTLITLNAGASVAGNTTSTSTAISDTAGNATVTVNTGSTIIGRVLLGNGVGTVAFNGGDFSQVTLFDGGAGAMTVCLLLAPQAYLMEAYSVTLNHSPLITAARLILPVMP